jgi:hypothetical protein
MGVIQTLRLTLVEAQARYRHQSRRKQHFFKLLYEFTNGQCGECSESGCACKDRICQHVEEHAFKKGLKFEHTGHALRFIGQHGCVIPPHLRETCTIYLCEKAQKKPDFDSKRYAKLKRICARIEWQMMELEDAFGLFKEMT